MCPRYLVVVGATTWLHGRRPGESVQAHLEEMDNEALNELIGDALGKQPEPVGNQPFGF